MNCSVEGCESTSKARGLCNTHYQQWRRTGSAVVKPKPVRYCEVELCGLVHYSSGYCSKHYQRMKKFGTTDMELPTLRERITSNIAVDDRGCWIYQNTPGLNGYSRMSVSDRLDYVHRLSYEEFVGPIPEGLTIDHLCMVRMCVNPKHLEPVTREENTRRELAARKEAS